MLKGDASQGTTIHPGIQKDYGIGSITKRHFMCCTQWLYINDYVWSFVVSQESYTLHPMATFGDI